MTLSKMIKEIIKDDRILPRKSWPFCGLKPINPANQTHGPKPILKIHEESQSLFEVIKKCCDYFPPVSRILIIVTHAYPKIPNEIINAITEIRGISPRVINSDTRNSQGGRDYEKFGKAIQDWLCCKVW